jgi:hypothetical protein
MEIANVRQIENNFTIKKFSQKHSRANSARLARMVQPYLKG